MFVWLTRQDLPEYFEDHMGEWMGAFHLLLVLPFNPAFANAVCGNVCLI